MSGRDLQPPEPCGGLSDLQRRCLDKRIDECTCALADAVCALREAQACAPREAHLDALSGLLRAAHGLTALAHQMCRTRTGRGCAHPRTGVILPSGLGDIARRRR